MTGKNFAQKRLQYGVCGVAGRQLMALDGNSDAGGGARLGVGGMELSLPAAGGGGGGRRVLGNRSFALYYRQRHPAVEQRQSVAVCALHTRRSALYLDGNKTSWTLMSMEYQPLGSQRKQISAGCSGWNSFCIRLKFLCRNAHKPHLQHTTLFNMQSLRRIVTN